MSRRASAQQSRGRVSLSHLFDAPTVTSITPTNGKLAAGTVVTAIAGTGFRSGATVTIGGTACTSVVVSSSILITCVAPVGTAGAKSVVVTNTDGKTGTLTNGYTYNPLPTVSAITPSVGSSLGGTAITNLAGTGFISGATVTIGGVAATSVVFVSATQLTCTTPAGSVGTANVVVTNPDTQSGTLAAGFTYQSVPMSLSPMVWYDLAHSTNSGGNLVTLPDQSGNGKDAVVTSAPGYTAANASFNNLPTMDFPDVATKRVTCPDLGLTTGAFTVVVVFTANAGSGHNGYVYGPPNGKGELYWGQTVAQLRLSNNDGTTNLTKAVAANTPSVCVCVHNGASSVLYWNARTAAASGNASTQDLTGRTIIIGNYGVSPGNTLSQAGSTAHFLVYNGAMAAGDVSNLLTYFGAAAGITIGA